MRKRDAKFSNEKIHTVLLPFLYLVIFCLIWFVEVESGFAQGGPTENERFVAGATYDPNIPTPEDTLGVPVGTRPARYHEFARYFRMLASSSPRAEFGEHGETHEGRTLFHLVISSEKNMSGVEEIRQNVARLADPRITNASEAQSLIENLPAIAWLGYCIHGDELSPADCAFFLAYHLVAGTDEATRFLLDNLVIIIDPLQNPDGRERYLTQIRMVQGNVPNPDHQSLQHAGFWPWGRTNHYFFDMNRDWLLLVHPESRGRIEALHQWNPQFFVDSHEMGSMDTFLFPPAREPFNPNLTETLKRWWKIYARDQAEAFDRHGWSYYTRDWFEMWYPGYSDSYIAFMGGIGILYEQARTTGALVKRRDGSILTFREAVHHNITGSLANLTTTATHRRELLQDFYEEKSAAITSGTTGEIRAIVVIPDRDPERARTYIQNLLRHHVEVYRTREETEVSGLVGRGNKKYEEICLPVGAYVIPLDQPLSPIVRAGSEFDPRMIDSFLTEERRELEKKRRTRLYDVTGWSMLLAYDLDAYESPHRVSVSMNRVKEIKAPVGRVEKREARYGFLMDAVGDASVRALALLLQRGCVACAAEKEFTAEGRRYHAGSILLRKHENPSDLPGILEEIAQETGAIVRGIDTALSDEGPDLGSQRFALLTQPRIGMFTGPTVSPYNYGALWHLLDHEIGLRFSSLDINRFGGLDLRKYNVLVLPTGWGYDATIGKTGIEKLKKWIESGGTLVAVGSGAVYVTGKSVGLSAVRHRRDVLDQLEEYKEALALEIAAATAAATAKDIWEYSPETVEDATPSEKKKDKGEKDIEKLKRLDEWERIFRPRGAILKAMLDPEHWLASGLGTELPVLVGGGHAFMSRHPVRTPARLTGEADLRLSGLLWPEARKRWAETAYATRERLGNGQIILLPYDPDSRGYFLGSRRVFLNAVLLGPGLGASQAVPW